MDVLSRFVVLIIDPAMYLLFTAGFLLFVYGLVQMLWKMREGSDHKEGLQHMLYGLLGMFIMVSVWGIIALLDNTFGLGALTGSGPDMSRLNSVQPVGSFNLR